MEVFLHLPSEMGLDTGFKEECVAPQPKNKSDDFYYILLYLALFADFFFFMLRK